MSEIVIVTGASSGIGLETATMLANDGYTVVACVRQQKDHDSLSKKKNFVPVILDVESATSVETARKELTHLLSTAGKVHLVNNAGIAVYGPVEGVSLDRWQKQFDVNVFGLLRVTQAFLPRIRETKGRIVNISSVSGLATSPYLAPYSASKFAVEAISDGLRRELASFGVKVIVIEPGPIHTPIWDKSFLHVENEIAAMGPELNNIYGHGTKKFAKMAAKSAQGAVPAEKVAQVIQNALKKDSPRTRYVVGSFSVHLEMFFVKIFSDKQLDRMIAKAFR